MTQTLIELVSRYSPSGQEGSAVEWLVGHMTALGYDQAFVDSVGNAVGVVGSGQRQIVLLGHIDTVPGEIPVRVSDGVLYGRGAVDAKGPLACFVDAAASVGQVDGWQLVVIGAVDEERQSTGARFAAGQYRPEFAVIGEPNRWDRVALGYKGAASASVTVRRSQAHSAAGQQTACETAMERWLAAQEFAQDFNSGKQRAFDKILPSLTGFDSGQDGFEQWARLQVSARLPLDVPPQMWFDHLQNLAQGAEIIQLGQPIPAWACQKNTPLVRAFIGAIRCQGGQPAFVYKTGTADLNIVAPVWKCPALVYGPGDSALDHTPDERISLEEYQQAVDVLIRALTKLISPDSTRLPGHQPSA